jgi:phosphoribosylanthranilate isomerase
MTKIKICGLTRDEDIDAVNTYMPNYVGFVFALSSRRLVPGTARLLIARLKPDILPVGVFVNETAEDIVDIAKYCRLGAVQLHGSEDHGYISRLRELLPSGISIWKAVRVSDAHSLEGVKAIDCDLLLLDSNAKGHAGGTGVSFDWRLLAGFPKPYLLAGGLHGENVGEAIQLLNPFGVDVSSGVETDGAKDEQKIGQFISLVRRIQR